MQLEIELKAWVRQPDSMEARLAARGFVRERSYRKSDRYFRAPQGFDVRLRDDDGQTLLTFKDKRLERGMEINQEHECTVSDAATLAELLGRLGCRDLVRKDKSGSAWRRGSLLCEFSLVAGLGHFLEIERVVEAADAIPPAERERLGAQADAEIRACLAELDIPESAVEATSFTKLLLELKSGQ